MVTVDGGTIDCVRYTYAVCMRVSWWQPVNRFVVRVMVCFPCCFPEVHDATCREGLFSSVESPVQEGTGVTVFRGPFLAPHEGRNSSKFPMYGTVKMIRRRRDVFFFFGMPM